MKTIVEVSKSVGIGTTKLKQIKSITIKDHEEISEIDKSGLLNSVKFYNNSSKYNLVIICTGYNSSLIKNLFTDQIVDNSY